MTTPEWIGVGVALIAPIGAVVAFAMKHGADIATLTTKINALEENQDHIESELKALEVSVHKELKSLREEVAKTNTEIASSMGYLKGVTQNIIEELKRINR